MRVYAIDLDGDLHDLRGRRAAFPLVYRHDDYAASQYLAKTLREDGSNGIAYDSVRRNGGECAAVFRPPLLSHAGRSGTCATSGTVVKSRRSTRSISTRPDARPERDHGGGVGSMDNTRRTKLTMLGASVAETFMGCPRSPRSRRSQRTWRCSARRAARPTAPRSSMRGRTSTDRGPSARRSRPGPGRTIATISIRAVASTGTWQSVSSISATCRSTRAILPPIAGSSRRPVPRSSPEGRFRSRSAATTPSRCRRCAPSRPGPTSPCCRSMRTRTGATRSTESATACRAACGGHRSCPSFAASSRSACAA